jgi:Zn-dependent peptidase ImmA (M78 family)/DNA-binding XRE family transcriptional regulator
MTVSALAERANVSVDRVNQWENGDRRPTFRQARHLAGALHIPFGYLFLSEPPTEELQLPDFRRVHPAFAGEPSAELLDTINDILVKQQWYLEYARGQGQQPLPFVGKFGINDAIDTIAADISRTVRLPRVRQESASWVEFLSNFTHAVEAAGVLVMKSGIVEGNIHRKLSVSEFRGFTVSDKLAPAIFINGADTRAAQIFTLAHELAHVWLDQSGISNEQMDIATVHGNGNLEVKCNAIAAEVLVPRSEVSWNKKADINTNLRFLSRAFRVSSLVVLRRGHDLGFVNGEEFLATYKSLLDAFIARDEEQSGGGDFYPTLYSRNSAVFTETLLSALGRGRASYTEAAEMLHVKVPTLSKIMGDLESKAV